MNTGEAEAPEIVDVEGKRISRVWIVPLIALVVGGLVMWKSLSEQGPLVQVHFSQGHGITAGKTEVRYADVAVGLVESVYLSDDLDTVIVEARLKPFMEPFLGETTQFWVVKANLRGTDLSGLSTLLSGSYIELGWEQLPEERQRVFDGLDERPLTPPGAAGRHFVLTAPRAGSVSVGSPVFYRDLPVGQIEEVSMDEDFGSVNYMAFVEAPYDQLLNRTTRFWNVSGVAVNLTLDGVTVEFASVDSLLAGGVAFGNIGRTIGAEEMGGSAPYRLYASRNAAIEAGFEIADGAGYLLMASFDESIRGLDAGAPVEWRGIPVGVVREVVLNLEVTGPDEPEIYAVVEMQPARVGLDNLTETELQQSISDWVSDGMRAQLATGNVLSGRKLIRLIDEAAPADESIGIDFSARPYPMLPTIPAANLGAVSANVERIVANIAELPVDQLVGAMIDLLENADALVGNPSLAEVPGELREALAALNVAAGNIGTASEDLPALVESMQAVVATGEHTLYGLSPDSELYGELSNAMTELRDATRALSELLQTLEDKPNALLLGR